VPSTTAETFYDLGIRALEEQERQVSSLRARTGTLVAAAAVAATLLAREVFAQRHPEGALEWLGSVLGVLGLAGVVAASVYLLRSHDLAFSVDARKAYRNAAEDGDLTVSALQVGLAVAFARTQARNQPTVSRMRVAFALALGGVVAEIVGLATAAALA